MNNNPLHTDNDVKPIDIPQWQKDLIDNRLMEYKNKPDLTLNWDHILKQIRKEDELL